MDIPFTGYRGGLKQLETNFNLPVQRDLFEVAFSKFEDIDQMHESLKEQGIHTFITAAGAVQNLGRRPRRFAGDLDLPPGRYFTLCSQDTFNDYGTLRDEIYGYYSGASSIDATILDPKVDTWLPDFLVYSGQLTEDDLKYPFYNFYYKVTRKTDRNGHITDKYAEIDIGSKIGVTYGVRQFVVELDNILDLRLPDTQEWFLKTFVEMELENESVAAAETNVSFPPKKRLDRFEELLPVIASLETGGGDIFGQAVGCWLRHNGADGLIFPSARSNVLNRVVNGNVVESKGWNLVLYQDAPAPTHTGLFGRTTSWVDRDHDHIRVKHIAEGDERGSFSIRGTKEWNLLSLDFERQIAHGLIDTQSAGFAVAEITGHKNYSLTTLAKQFLDLEEQKGKLWFNDVDATNFTSFLERKWMKED
jgi:hypothetical protein